MVSVRLSLAGPEHLFNNRNNCSRSNLFELFEIRFFSAWGENRSKQPICMELPLGVLKRIGTARLQHCTATVSRRHLSERDKSVAAVLLLLFNLETFCMVAVNLLWVAVTIRSSSLCQWLHDRRVSFKLLAKIREFHFRSPRLIWL